MHPYAGNLQASDWLKRFKQSKLIHMLINPTQVETTFHKDVVQGLSAPSKHLFPKYFYDAKGDYLFQQIMDCPEYYLTRAEREILSTQSQKIAQQCADLHPHFDLVELGAGDASKTTYLLDAALQLKCCQRYFPIDISESMIEHLNWALPPKFPGLHVKGLAGEYFPMLEHLKSKRAQPKLVLFLGASIGNMLPDEALAFCQSLRTFLNPGDLLLIGFDLKKNPQIILDAYNDRGGLTRDFNHNLLHRINRELGANFNTSYFKHYPVYDPGTGSCKSYLISTRSQSVVLSDGTEFSFDKDEAIYMEVSQKYSKNEIDQLGLSAGYEAIQSYFDQQRWFVDVLWRVPFNS